MITPPVVVHSDWSVDPSKRWMTRARFVSGAYRLELPEFVGQTDTFLERVAVPGTAPALIGFDFPIGVPSVYAQRAQIDVFVDVLPEFGKGKWERFFDLAEDRTQICLTRPFYPRRPGGTKRSYLRDALELTEVDLYRQCERSNGGRNSACSLFWTLGGNQVGRAALAGWREVLQPQIQTLGADIGIWPFHGDVQGLLEEKGYVIAETYPAESCIQLGLPAPGRGWSKRNQTDRVLRAHELVDWAGRNHVDLGDKVSEHMRDGFGPDKNGEDQFDSMVGLLAMLNVILGNRGDGAPDSASIRRVEGWIFGMTSVETSRV